MSKKNYLIREALPNEHIFIGQFLVDIYSNLENFQTKEEQPEYYNFLLNIGEIASKPKVKILVAESNSKAIEGVIVYFGDMKYYGSGSVASREKHAAGFRLLAVANSARGEGLGKLLSQYCIDLARKQNQKELIIHSTNAMKIAWKMYEKMGFIRSEDLDFTNHNYPIYGFRLQLIN